MMLYFERMLLEKSLLHDKYEDIYEILILLQIKLLKLRTEFLMLKKIK